MNSSEVYKLRVIVYDDEANTVVDQADFTVLLPDKSNIAMEAMAQVSTKEIDQRHLDAILRSHRSLLSVIEQMQELAHGINEVFNSGDYESLLELSGKASVLGNLGHATIQEARLLDTSLVYKEKK